MKRMPTAALLLAAAGLAVALPVLAAVSNPRPEAEIPGLRPSLALAHGQHLNGFSLQALGAPVG